MGTSDCYYHVQHLYTYLRWVLAVISLKKVSWHALFSNKSSLHNNHCSHLSCMTLNIPPGTRSMTPPVTVAAGMDRAVMDHSDCRGWWCPGGMALCRIGLLSSDTCGFACL